MPRLFVAVGLPEAVRTGLADLPRRVSGARWVPTEQIHLTLRFIGDVGDALFADVKTILGEIESPPFSLGLRHGGAFPPRGQPRILWVGVDRCEPLMALQRQIEDALVSLDFPRERRAYHPHATLARLKNARPGQVQTHIEAIDALASPEVAVDRFALFSSVLSPKGATHQLEAAFPLGR